MSKVEELTQEKLLETYFASGVDKTKRAELPLVIRVVEKKGPEALIPWVITSIAFLITAFSLFSTKRIFVDIHVVDEKAAFIREAPASTGVANAPLDNAAQRINLQDFVFEGASRLNSSAERSVLTLVNSSLSSFGRASLYFKNPFNWQDSKLVFYAKGSKGGENVAVALKDTENVLAFSKGKIRPFPNGLTGDWQRVELEAVSATMQEFNPRKVASLRFEIGSKDTDNRPGDTVLIRDLQMVPA